MARIVTLDPDSAARLAGIARIAFGGRGRGWSAEAFLALGDPLRAAMIVDDGFRDAVLILRMAADEAEILDFGVAPVARRRGLGRELLAAAETLAGRRGVARLFLEVAIDNAPARALYAGSGFVGQGDLRWF